MMGREKDEEMDMGEGSEGGAPVAVAAPPQPQVEPTSVDKTAEVPGTQENAVNSGGTLGFEPPTATSTPDGSVEEKGNSPKTPEQIRKEQWDHDEIPIDILEAGKADVRDPKPGVTLHSLVLRKPRAEFPETRGKIYTHIDISKLTNSQHQEAVDHGLIKQVKDPNGEIISEGIEAYREFHDSKAYSRFVVQNKNTLYVRDNYGFQPRENKTAKDISEAYLQFSQQPAEQNVRNAQEKLTDAVGVAEAAKATAENSDEKVAQKLDEQQQEPKPQSKDGMTPEDELVKKAEAELKDAEDQAEQEALREQYKKKRESTEITENDAGHLLDTFNLYKKQEQDLREKLKTASPEEKNDLEKQLSEVCRQKAEVMLTAIGFDQTDIVGMLERSRDTNIPLLLQLIRKTSLSKEKGNTQETPNILKLNQLVKAELIQSVADAINSISGENEKEKDGEQVRFMNAREALRGVMKSRGILDEQQQNILLDEFMHHPDLKNLGVEDDDHLDAVFEAIISQKRPDNIARDVREAVQQIQEKVGDAKEFAENAKAWFEKHFKDLKDILGSEKALAAGVWIAALLQENLDVGAFISMLLVGEGHSAMLDSLGYKSKDALMKEGRRLDSIVDADEVADHIHKNEAPADTSKNLLLGGLHGLIPDATYQEFVSMEGPTKLLTNDHFRAVLLETVKREHAEFTARILWKLNKISVSHIDHEVELMKEGKGKESYVVTKDAMNYILCLPELAEKSKWGDEKPKEQSASTVTLTGVENKVPKEHPQEPIVPSNPYDKGKQ